MKQILVVEDDPFIGDLLAEALGKEGYGVLRAYSGTEALLVLSGHRPDLVLLDLMLPGLSGEELLPQLRDMPVIVVSAKADVAGKTGLLWGGAVDYVTKPFALPELLARIAVQFRRLETPSATALSSGPLRLDTVSRSVSVDGTPVSLTRTEYAILKQLLQNAGRVVARSALLDRISADTPDCTESSLKMHVSNLRRKLREAGGEDRIEAVWGIGFQIKAE